MAWFGAIRFWNWRAEIEKKKEQKMGKVYECIPIYIYLIIREGGERVNWNYYKKWRQKMIKLAFKEKNEEKGKKS